MGGTRGVNFIRVAVLLCFAITASLGATKLAAAQPRAAHKNESPSEPSPKAVTMGVAPVSTESTATNSNSSQSHVATPRENNIEHTLSTTTTDPNEEGNDDRETPPSPVFDAAEAAERRSLGESDTILVTQGPVAFWLEYEATDEDRTHLRLAEAIQSDIDRLTWEAETVKRELRDATERSVLKELRHTRDAAMDRIPDLWASCWRSTLGFQRQVYWRPRAAQSAPLPEAPSDEDGWNLAADWYQIPVDDEIFLTRALKRLRCTTVSRDTADVRDEGSHPDERNGDPPQMASSATVSVFRLEMEFGDAPGLLYPFQERYLVKELPIALGHRFDHEAAAWGEDEEAVSESGDEVVPVLTPPTRTLGTGTVVTFRVEHADAAGRRAAPHLGSFFSLFASEDLYQGLPLQKWLELQARVNTLVEDVCESYHSCVDRIVEPSQLHSAEERPREASDHHVAFERWQEDVAAEAARLGDVAGVAER